MRTVAGEGVRGWWRSTLQVPLAVRFAACACQCGSRTHLTISRIRCYDVYMRTTLTLDNDIADSLREQARLLDRPFKQVVNDTLRRGMSPVVQEDRPVFRVVPLSGGFRPGVDLLKLNQLNDELETQAFTERDAE